MADSTIPVLTSSFEDSFSSWIRSIPGKVMDIGVDAGLDSDSPIVKLGACGLAPAKCAFKLMKYAVYGAPKDAVNFSFLASKKIFNAVSYFTPKPPVIVSEIFREAVTQIKELAHTPTSWITGKTVEELKKVYLKEAEEMLIDPYFSPSFRAVDLIGPLFLNYLCQQKAWNNLNSTLSDIKSLLSGGGVTKTGYVTSSVKANMKVENKLEMDDYEITTPFDLLTKSIIGTVLTGLWGTGAYLTGREIYNVIKEAAKGSANEDMRVKTAMGVVMVGYVALPMIFSKLGIFGNPAPSHKTFGSPPIAPHLAYDEPLTDATSNSYDNTYDNASSYSYEENSYGRKDRLEEIRNGVDELERRLSATKNWEE